MPCNCCEITDQAFGEDEARSNLKRYRKRGPANQTRAILDAIRSQHLHDATLLDIGGGVGAIHQELFQDVISSATHVDASRAYLNAAEQEAARRGHAEQVRFLQADFTDVASELPPADIVTLDRVVCCYPDFRSLLTAAAGRSRRLLAMSYPRETWYMRIGLGVIDFFQSLRRDPFRVFLHPIHEMDAVLAAGGMQRVSIKRLFVWEIALYSRA
ncbi:MAG: class I SAM-dependent methyltransferase [Anaerolineae bacterium]